MGSPRWSDAEFVRRAMEADAKGEAVSIRPQRRNANRHTQRGMQALETSLAKDGWIGAITVAADGETFDGSARVEKTAENGMLEEAIIVDSDGTRPIVVRRVDIATATDPRAVRLSVAANRVASLNLEWEPDVLASIADSGVDLGALFTADEWADVAMPALPDAGGGGDEFDATPADGPTRTALGELWSIGGVHRLLVGDCTDAANVARLMGEERAQGVVSDPPYGQKKAGKPHHFTGGVGQRKVFKTAFVDPDAWADPIDWIPLLMDCCDGNWFVMAGGERMLDVGVELQRTEMIFGALFTWKKTNAPPGMGNYPRTDCEYIWWMRGRDASCKAMSLFNSLVVEMPMPQAGAFASERITKDGGEAVHPTQKPTSLIELFIQGGVIENGIVLDPFLGSGTTLIAAHRTGRRCYGMEIAPRYADVILRRAEAEGLEVTRIDG